MTKRSVMAVAASLALLLPGARTEPRPAARKAGTEITWYGQSAFVLKTPAGTVLVIDPWFKGPRSPDPDAGAKLARVDRILVSHGHPDHLGDAIEIARRTGAKITGSSDLVRTLVTLGLPKEAGDGSVGNAGGVFEVGDATIALVPAVHSSQVVGENGASLPGGQPLGFVIRVKGGPTLYHTGDTDAFSDMKLIPERYGPIDVLLACIGGRFTMDAKGAALAAGFVKAKTVIPMHYGGAPASTDAPAQLEAALGRKAKVLVLEPGKPVVL